MTKSSEQIICPFCGKDISNDHHQHIPQEDTVSSNHSFESHWHGGYMRTTKYKRQYSVSCCKECYDENQRFEQWADKYVVRVYPIASLLAIIANIVRCHISNNWSFSLVFWGSILYIFIGILITGIPVIIGNLVHKKSTTYKHAKKCNAIY